MNQKSLQPEHLETKSDADRVLRLLTERAERLARRNEVVDREENVQSILIFTLGEERFATRLTEVSAVAPLKKLTVVPTADPKILGAMAIQGEVHCIFDLTRVLDLPPSTRPSKAERDDGYVVVLRIPGVHVGFAVSRIESMDEIVHEANTKDADAVGIRRWTGRSFVQPRTAAPLILIENFKHHLLTLLQEEDPS